MPAIGKLPVFRKLLNSSEKNKEKSQMVIFLVPRIETENVFIEQQREKKICEKINELLELLEV